MKLRTKNKFPALISHSAKEDFTSVYSVELEHAFPVVLVGVSKLK